MGLQVWMPLNNNLDNQGLGSVTFVSGTQKFKSSGKIGTYGYDLSSQIRLRCSDLIGTKRFTIMFWVKIEDNDTLTTNWNKVFMMEDEKADGSGVGNLRCETCYGSAYAANHPTRGTHWHNNTNYSITNYSSNNYTAADRGIWHHVALAVDSDNGVWAYVDGALVGSTTTVYGGHLLDDFYIGDTNNISGCMNDLRIYDEVVSVKMISEIAKGLVCHYTLGDTFAEGTTNLITSLTSGRNTVVIDGNAIQNTGENADTYWFFNIPSSALITNNIYTLSCYVTGLPKEETGCRFGVGAQASTDSLHVGYLWLSNGFNSLTFSCPSSLSGSTRVICDDLGGSWRTNIFTISNIQLEEKDHFTGYTPFGTTRNENIVYDVSGYSRNGTISGTITVDADTPRYWTSSVFDGNTSLIKISDLNLHPMLGSEWTCAFWVYNNDSGGRSIFFSGYGFTTGASFGIEKTTGNATRIYWAGAPDICPSGYTVPVNQWCHLAFVGTPTSIKCYLNGELKYTYTGTLDVSKLVANTTYGIGRDNRTGTTAFNGKMSDLRFYATCLSADDILALYNTPISLSSNGTLMTQGEFTEA